MASAARWTAFVAAGVAGVVAIAAWRQSTPPNRLYSLAPTTVTSVSNDALPAAARFAAFLATLIDPKADIADAGTPGALASLQHDPEVVDLLGAQPEVVKTAGAYVAALVSDARIEAGQMKKTERAELLAAIEQRFGVDRHVLLAIWGIESNFGAAMGSRDVLRSLATLAAFDQRRAGFWRGELDTMLQILRSGSIRPEHATGSWAGAMGHTQFMPSTYAAHAVDFDGDGVRDIWTSVPDALASTANYLKVSGWQSDLPWGFEVTLPVDFDYGLGAVESMPWAQWQTLGVAPARAAGMQIGDAVPLNLLLPMGRRGPAFLATVNFQALLRYNNAVPYALAVGHLADRMAGREPLLTSWPADERGITRVESQEVQQRLTQLGFDAGAPDGIIGSGSRAAVRAFQKSRGLPQDGHADLALLQRLRQEGE